MAIQKFETDMNINLILSYQNLTKLQILKISNSKLLQYKC